MSEQEKTIIERLQDVGVLARPTVYDAPGDDPAYVVIDGEALLALLEKPKRKRTAAKPPSETALRCSEFLIEQLQGVKGAVIGPKAKTAWARDIDRLIRDSGRTGPSIVNAIAWVLDPCRVDDQYTPVVRSGKALREKWPQIVAAMSRRSPEQSAEAEKQQQRAALEAKYG